jgi:hypothetical protein
MTLEQLIKSSLDDWSADVPVPVNLSAPALRRGRRMRATRRRTALAGVVVVVAAIAVPVAIARAVPSSPQASAHQTPQASEYQTAPAGTDHENTLPPLGATPTVQPSNPPSTAWAPLALTQAHSGNTSISAHVSESPPTHLIAADDLAVSAYYFESGTKRTWYLYNSTSGTYHKTTWSTLDVSPGLGLAAVLESPLPSRRIGIVNIATGVVNRWISTSNPVESVAFSPDGTRLVATTYADNSVFTGGLVTGFVIIDLSNGDQTDVTITGEPYNSVLWTYNGAYLYLIVTNVVPPTASPSQTWFYHPDGHLAATPAHAEELTWSNGYGANVSPNGTMSPANANGGARPLTAIQNLKTGRIIGTQPVEDLQGWANNDNLIAWGCDAKCANEFHSRLVLVSLDGKTITPLSGYVAGKSDASPGQWRILLTRR